VFRVNKKGKKCLILAFNARSGRRIDSGIDRVILGCRKRALGDGKKVK
jgi:hypothetical protein